VDLAGPAIATEVLHAKIEHAERTSQGCVYVHGLGVALNPNLAEVAESARRRGLQVALIEDGPGAGLAARVRSLQSMKISRVYLTLYGGAAATHDAITNLPGSWKQQLATLVGLSRDRSIEAGVHFPLNRRTANESDAMLRVQAHLAVDQLLVSDGEAEAGGPDLWSPNAALAALERAWVTAQTRRVRMRFMGFARTRHVNPSIGQAASTCDSTLLESIRLGIPLAAPRAGVHARGGYPGRGGQMVPESTKLASDWGDFRNLGFELAARACPFIDVPPCLGGAQSGASRADESGSVGFVKADACADCPFDVSCPGGAPELDAFPASPLKSALRPLPHWRPLSQAPRILILSSEGEDPIFYASTLPGLADALRQRGATVELVSPWLSVWDAKSLPRMPDDVRYQRRWEDLMAQLCPDNAKEQGLATPLLTEAHRRLESRELFRDPYVPAWKGTTGVEAWIGEHGLGGFDLVIASDYPTAVVALAAGSLERNARLVALDFHMLKDMNAALGAWLPASQRAAAGGWWPSEQLTIDSGFPGYVRLYRNYGVPLDRLAWRPYSLYPGHFPFGPDVGACQVIMSGGNHQRDHATLLAATACLTSDVHPLLLYDQGERFEGNAHLLHEGEVRLLSFYHAISHSRFVVLPLKEDATKAAGITVLAMALMAGRPVVATGITAIRDYMHHGREGLLVPPGDAKALAEAITRLDTDKELLSTMAAHARDAGRRLSTESWAEQIIAGDPRTPVASPFGWRCW